MKMTEIVCSNSSIYDTDAFLIKRRKSNTMLIRKDLTLILQQILDNRFNNRFYNRFYNRF